MMDGYMITEDHATALEAFKPRSTRVKVSWRSRAIVGHAPANCS